MTDPTRCVGGTPAGGRLAWGRGAKGGLGQKVVAGARACGRRHRREAKREEGSGRVWGQTSIKQRKIGIKRKERGNRNWWVEARKGKGNKDTKEKVKGLGEGSIEKWLDRRYRMVKYRNRWRRKTLYVYSMGKVEEKEFSKLQDRLEFISATLWKVSVYWHSGRWNDAYLDACPVLIQNL